MFLLCQLGHHLILGLNLYLLLLGVAIASWLRVSFKHFTNGLILRGDEEGGSSLTTDRKEDGKGIKSTLQDTVDRDETDL